MCVSAYGPAHGVEAKGVTGMVTIRDVAQQCGVSVSTVSRVINDHPDVSERVRRRVHVAIDELSYVPNKAAQDLVHPQGDSIGVIVRGADNPFYVPIVRAIEEVCELAGYAMVMCQLSDDADEVGQAAALVKSKRLKGVILLGGHFDYDASTGAVIGVPFACCTFTNCFGSLDRGTYSSVSIDDVAEAERATQLLLDTGHRTIALLTPATDDQSISELRYKGFRSALGKAKVPLDEGLVLETGSFSMASAYGATAGLVGRRRDVTAIFAISDAMALAAMKALAEAGRRVPEDVSLVAIDGLEVSLYSVPTLTTLVQPTQTMGERAAQILIDQIEGRGQARHVRLPTDLRTGGTLVRPPGTSTP